MAKMTTKGKVAVGVAAGLVAAGAAAGYYFYGSSKAKSHRKIAAKWATDMKKEVMKRSKRLEDITAKDFAKVVDTVARTYRGVKSINAADLKRAASELKENWRAVGKEMKQANRKDAQVVKNIVKRASGAEENS